MRHGFDAVKEVLAISKSAAQPGPPFRPRPPLMEDLDAGHSVSFQVEMEARFLILFSGYFVSVFSYPYGQISASCDTMLPQHKGNRPQATASPFFITVSKTSFNSGDSITVKIQSSSDYTFKGFILEALSVGGDTITGAFTTTGNTQGLSCSGGPNSAVSHSDPNPKTSITTSWTAPSGVGPVRFRATVLHDFVTFWSEVESGTLMPLQISNTTCGTAKFCFSDPANCSPNSSNCLFMSAVPSSSGYVFEMSGSTSGYIAIGFSDDQKMGSDDYYICAKNSSENVLIQRAYSTGPVTPQSRNASLSGSPVSSYINGVLNCIFSSGASISTSPSRASASSAYFIFLATGPTQANGQIQQHIKNPLITATKIDLSIYGSTKAASGSSSLVLGHGALMLIAWMTTGTIGMLIARYMKNAAKEQYAGKGLWFLLHVFLMILTVMLTSIAFIMIFSEVAGWSSDTGAHPVLGCIVMILSFLQPFGALLRPAPNDKRRFIFNWAHGLNALVIKVLAVATLFLGLQLVDTSSNQWMPKVMGGFYGWEVLFYIILEVNARWNEKAVYEEVYKKLQSESVILVTFVCGNLAFLIALLVGIGQS
ncbi:putative ferric-chelate reductase 1 isoform X2 [Xenopus laevis]|uniref:Ferric-chelate reductase 1 isoform X2 n=1 Tax=Xenopus laevis TaxID=8355 RepID=A0A8J0V2T6_XENLA|nr:putative ferric-chelate reductase 1 isoform X2 [Xenopus laevis]